MIALIVAVLLTALFWFLLYKPAREQQAAIEAETLVLEQQAASLSSEIAQLRDIEARQVEIRAALARLEEFIPVGSAQPAAIRQFQRAADAAGSELVSVTFGEPAVPVPAQGATPADTGTPGTTLANIPITMTVDGGYFQLVDFFRRLEVDVPRAILVESVGLSEAADEGFPTLSAAWSGQVFAIVSSGDLVDTQAGVPAPDASATETPTPAPEGGAQ